MHEHQARTSRLRAEHARSPADLQRFREENPEFIANEAAMARYMGVNI
jgi:hypothetical protein